MGQTVSLHSSACCIALAQGWCAACDATQVVIIYASVCILYGYRKDWAGWASSALCTRLWPSPVAQEPPQSAVRPVVSPFQLGACRSLQMNSPTVAPCTADADLQVSSRSTVWCPAFAPCLCELASCDVSCSTECRQCSLRAGSCEACTRNSKRSSLACNCQS